MPLRNLNAGSVNDANKKIAPAATRGRQTFTGDADNFASRNPRWQSHRNHSIVRPGHSFGAPLGRPVERNSQVAAQIGPARLEAPIRQRFHPHMNDSSGRAAARNPEARTRRGVLRDLEPVDFRPVSIGRVMDPNVERCAAKKRANWNVNILLDRHLPGTAAAAVASLIIIKITVVDLTARRVAQDFMRFVDRLHLSRRRWRMSVSIGMEFCGQRSISRPDLRSGASAIQP